MAFPSLITLSDKLKQKNRGLVQSVTEKQALACFVVSLFGGLRISGFKLALQTLNLLEQIIS